MDENNYLTLPLPICPLKDGKFIIPKTCDKLWLDIGTSHNCPNGVQFLKRNKNGFVIGVDPNPRMYFTMYSMYLINKQKWLCDGEHPSGKKESDKRIKHQKRQIFNNLEEYLKCEDAYNRFIFLPCAILESEGFHTLYNNSHEGSTSFNPRWHGSLINDTLQTYSMKLSRLIKMIPERFEYIEHLKVDCESLDLIVLKSAEDLISKAAVVTIEDGNAAQYLLKKGFEFLETQNGGHSFINKTYKHLLPKLDYFIRV